MNPSRLLTIPATFTPWTPADDPDEYNDEVLEPQNDVDLLVWYEPINSTENVPQNSTEQLYKLFLRPDAAVTSTGQITIENAGTFELIGLPGPFTDPRSHQVTHFETTMRRVA